MICILGQENTHHSECQHCQLISLTVEQTIEQKQSTCGSNIELSIVTQCKHSHSQDPTQPHQDRNKNCSSHLFTVTVARRCQLSCMQILCLSAIKPQVEKDGVTSGCLCLILTGLELAKMSSMPVDVLEEASAIASNLTRAKSLLSEEFPDATKKTHELGRQLVQVARNSLLDQESLR